MKDFYSIEENFEFLYNDISILLSGKIVDSSLAENWLVNWYMCNKYNTTKAIERYAADLIIPKLKESEIPHDSFKSIIDKKLNKCYESYNEEEVTLEDKKYMIENIQQSKINETTLKYIIQDFECDEIIEYIRESYLNDIEIKANEFELLDENSKEVLNILSHIKNIIIENREVDDRLNYIKECNSSILYKFKYALESADTKADMYKSLESLLDSQSDDVVTYAVNELNHCNELIEHFVMVNSGELDEKNIYNKAVEKFNHLVETIFFDETDEDIDLEQFATLCAITDALCEYESTMEASSRIITKGTDKVVRAVGNSSAKARGMTKSDSKIGQLKRGAKIVDDRVSGAINSQIDQIVNFSEEAKREKIISGRSSIRLSRLLKTIIGAIVAGKVVSKLPKQKVIGIPFTKLWIKAPLLGMAATAISLLTARALSKNTEVREKRKILFDLETELKITKEKIEDAKGDNVKEQKYQLMRIESQLEKEIFRIKHGMKPY